MSRSGLSAFNIPLLRCPVTSSPRWSFRLSSQAPLFRRPKGFSGFRDLTEPEKKAFLQYDVAVRDLGNVGRDEIIEVFKRLNATKYSLLDIEVNNASLYWSV